MKLLKKRDFFRGKVALLRVFESNTYLKVALVYEEKPFQFEFNPFAFGSVTRRPNFWVPDSSLAGTAGWLGTKEPRVQISVVCHDTHPLLGPHAPKPFYVKDGWLHKK